MLVLVCVSLIASAFLYGSGETSVFVWVLYGLLWSTFFYFSIGGKRAVLIALALGLTFFLGIYRLSLIDLPIPLYGERTVVGVVRAADVRLDKSILTVREEKSGAKVQLHTRSGTYLPGDRVTAEGDLQKPKPFLTETGRMFDYDAYLTSRGVTAVMFDADVSSTGERSSSVWLSIIRFATKVRLAIAGALSSHIAFPIDGIISGMLVGYQGGIPDDVSDTFQRTGLLHMLVLSGYNITMLGGVIGLVFRKFPLGIKNLSIALGILLLVLVSGAGVSAIRAGLMGAIGILATSSRNKYDAFRALTVTFLIFFIISPLSIMHDPGFHLSFLATFFLIAILPKLAPYFSWLPKIKGFDLGEYIALTSGIAIFMVPYLLYFSGVFPYVTPLANALVGPLVPLFMLLGIGVVLLSPFAPLASLLGSVVSFVGELVLSGIHYLGTFPVYEHPPFVWWVLVVIYGSIIILFFWREILSFMKTLR